MKKSIRQKSKSQTATDKKHSRPFTTKQTGYKENVYNNEEQNNYEKSDTNKKNNTNTAGPES